MCHGCTAMKNRPTVGRLLQWLATRCSVSDSLFKIRGFQTLIQASHPSHDGPCQQACSHKHKHDHGRAYRELVTRRLRSAPASCAPFLPCLGKNWPEWATDVQGDATKVAIHSAGDQTVGRAHPMPPRCRHPGHTGLTPLLPEKHCL